MWEFGYASLLVCAATSMPTCITHNTLDLVRSLSWVSCFHKNPYFGFLIGNLIFGAKLSTFTLWCQIVQGAKLSTVLNCPWCQIVHFYPWFQIVLVSSVPNCPSCQIISGAKLSVVPNCPLKSLSAKRKMKDGTLLQLSNASALCREGNRTDSIIARIKKLRKNIDHTGYI